MWVICSLQVLFYYTFREKASQNSGKKRKKNCANFLLTKGADMWYNENFAATRGRRANKK